MHKLSYIVFWIAISSLPIIQALEVSIQLFGPFNQCFCFSFITFKNIVRTTILLFLCANIIARYILIFHLKNPLAVVDGFWCVFISSWIFGFGLSLNFVLYFLPGRQPTNYYICSGIDPTPFLKLPQKAVGRTEIFSFVIHFLVKSRILYFKRINYEGYAGGNQNASNGLFNLDFKSLADFTTNILIILAFALLALLNMTVSSMTLAEMNKFPNYIIVYVFQLLGPCLLSFSVGLIYYSRHQALRVDVFKRFSSLIQKLISNN
jgi:formate-dependent nitrite reductase membrane component NrfD